MEGNGQILGREATIFLGIVLPGLVILAIILLSVLTSVKFFLLFVPVLLIPIVIAARGLSRGPAWFRIKNSRN